MTDIFDNFEPDKIDGRYTVPNKRLIEIAKDIVGEYIIQRPRYTPGKVTIPKAAAKHFYKAAELCRDLEETPEVFVATQLKGMALTGKFWPSAIGSEKLRDISEDSEPTPVDLGRYRAMLAAWTNLSKSLGPVMALRDPQSPFSPLFRACLAYDRDQEVYMACKDMAVEEYSRSKIAQELFCDFMKKVTDGSP